MAENDNATGVSGGVIERRRRDDVHLDDTPVSAAAQPLTEALACPTCGRVFKSDKTVSLLLAYVAENPGHSAWELSVATGIDYRDASRALRKARAWGAVEWDVEVREAGGTRYRYRVASDWKSGGVA